MANASNLKALPDAGMPAHVDVAVVGAGPAGSATARWLAQRGRSVALIEQSQFDTPHIGESLAPAVQPLLMELGVWAEFLASKPLPSYGTRSYWGEATAATHSHLLSRWGCGWHVDRRAFDLMLARAACAAGATPCFGVTLSNCRWTVGGWKLELQRANEEPSRRYGLRAGVVIDASGRGARLSRGIGAERLFFDRLIGVATQFGNVESANQGCVTVETTPDGWWYSAPVPAGDMMVMLMTDGEFCGRLHLARQREWLAELDAAPATRSRVTGGHVRWGPRVFCASTQRSRRRERRIPWLAVGDAALAVDPVSGSGVVRALRSARAAAEVAIELAEGRGADAVEQYETEYDRQCTIHLKERAMYYGLEQRWPTHPFWARRLAAYRAVANSAQAMA